MKRFIATCLLLAGCLCMNGFIVQPTVSRHTETAIIEPDVKEVENARIENLLNHNNVYGEDFLSNEKLTNLAAISLRSYADDNGFINQDIVTAYVKDMYDIDLVITDDINADMPKKEGCVYLIPRGFAKYTHTNLSVTDYDDYLVVESTVTVYYHDGGYDCGISTTILIPNENATYGYNIIDANIIFNSYETEQI